ncbi:PUA-like domain-containing protein [Fimicolochytrium jonesii]|uniref:PUA-like domain-containing protein n=1 Tax=Fimicolochytrium jonesii TaxID=1396493 RepID=UPI0022FEE10A|nr:PUA-like domain-containing protein [Fimicolochytrium jonesii]KAI8823104.1 PUA-like domain-containing protein [Fimicolochytrium jonesii]
MLGTSSYEQQRALKIAANKALLESLGVREAAVSSNPPPPVTRPKKKNVVKTLKRTVEDGEREGAEKRVKMGGGEEEEEEEVEEVADGVRVRRSRRLKAIAADKTAEALNDVQSDTEEAECTPPSKHGRAKPSPIQNFIGAHPTVPPGTVFPTRLACSRALIHRPPVSGIHGTPAHGCYSLALSGGYEDDIDLGAAFTYTGEGGRDLRGTKANPKNLRTAPQSRDQTLTKGNAALKRSCETGAAVRVVRGWRLGGRYAPREGYRYDGVYRVERCWCETGLAGFLVWKFALVRVEGQGELPVRGEGEVEEEEEDEEDEDKENENENENKDSEE